MAWRIELSDLARKNLKQLDPQAARRILSFLNDRLTHLAEPRAIGEALRGSKLGELWKYRVGDSRIISSIEDKTVRIIVVRIASPPHPEVRASSRASKDESEGVEAVIAGCILSAFARDARSSGCGH